MELKDKPNIFNIENSECICHTVQKRKPTTSLIVINGVCTGYLLLMLRI
jgi:hypothetical protein